MMPVYDAGNRMNVTTASNGNAGKYTFEYVPADSGDINV